MSDGSYSQVFADVAGHQGAGFTGGLDGQFECFDIQLLQDVLLTDGLQLRAVGVIGACHDHVGSRPHKFPVQDPERRPDT